MKLLILEDDQELALDWSETFTRNKWAVRIAYDASEARAAVTEEKFDLVISDMYIVQDGQIVPDGGVTLLGLLRTPRTKGDPGYWMNIVPVLVISGSVENTPGRFSMYHIAESMGATRILGKPVLPDIIYKVAMEMTEKAAP
jgi:CheY-like chemotaxis protein